MVSLHPWVKRTSEKGVPFIGRCPSCGKEGITFDMLTSDPCSNPRKLTTEDALLEAIEDRSEHG